MGTTAGPSIMSPNSGYVGNLAGFTNMESTKTKKNQANHKRVASTIVPSGPPDITAIM